MKMNLQTLLMTMLFLICHLCFFNSKAQTYATPELKTEAEKWEAERIAKNPISTKIINTKEKELEQPKFNMKVDKTMFVVSSIDAVDYSGKHTDKEMKGFEAEAKEELEKKNYILDLVNNKFYMYRRYDNLWMVDKNFNINNGLLTMTNCKECQDAQYKVVVMTDDKIVLELQPQDEGQFFGFRFTFTK